jgi:hypothetical protein
MHSPTRRSLATLLVSASLALGCAVPLDYHQATAKTVLSADDQRDTGLMMVDLLDARDSGASSDLPLIHGQVRADDLQELRHAVRAHAKRSGLVADEGAVLAAPTNQSELQQALALARDQGAKVLLLLRLEDLYAEGNTARVQRFTIPFVILGILPGVVAYSLPFSKEYAFVRVRAYLVDPATGRVLETFEEVTQLHDKAASQWGAHPAGELGRVMFKTIDGVFARTATLVGSQELGAGSSATIDAMLFAPAKASSHGEAKAVLESSHPIATIEHPTYNKMRLVGPAAFMLTARQELRINVRSIGSRMQSPCNFWFRAPIRPKEWGLPVGKESNHRITIPAGHYEAEQSCGSRYDGSTPLVLDFPARAEGETFVSSMLALETAAGGTTAAASAP